MHLFLRATIPYDGCIYHQPWLSFVILQRGLGFVTSPLWVGEKDPVVSCGESGDQFCFFLAFQAWPVNDRWLWSRGFFFANSFRSSSCVPEEGSDGNGCIPLVFGGMEDSFHSMSVVISRRKIYVFNPYLTLIVVYDRFVS